MIPTRVYRGSLAAFCLAAIMGCEKPEAPAVAPVETVEAAPSAPAPVPPVTTAVQVDPETLPAEEDFEEEAEVAITPANLEKQLELMEKELVAQ
jgi:hypothetical protein